MQIETKTLSYAFDDYLKFGWELAETKCTRSGRSTHTSYVLARDKEMAHYAEIAALENKYFHLKSQKKRYQPLNIGWCLLALLVFIVPGVLYITFKTLQKRKIYARNRELQQQMDAVLSDTQKLLGTV